VDLSFGFDADPSHEEKPMHKINTLEDLYVEQLRELYNAEIQLIDVLPEMMKATHDPELKADFEHHLQQTYVHVERIEQMLDDLNQSPTGHKCDIMVGLVREAKKSIRAEEESKNAALLAVAQRMEHYEVAGYGRACTYAFLLGNEEDSDTLQMTLDEEMEMQCGLTKKSEELSAEPKVFASHR
jgi:ferritin-like metal-binding protein YciE